MTRSAAVGAQSPTDESGRDWRRYDPERLTVYRLARAHTRAVAALLAAASTRGFSDLVDQTRRSTASMPASTTETWAHIDTLVDFGCTSPESIAEIRSLQNQIIALLVTMIKNLQEEI